MFQRASCRQYLPRGRGGTRIISNLKSLAGTIFGQVEGVPPLTREALGIDLTSFAWVFVGTEVAHYRKQGA
jgi:hypothetical protein